MPLLFSYGTLQRDDVQLSTFGRLLRGHPDELSGVERSSVRIVDPEIVAASGETHYANLKFNGRNDSRVSGTLFDITDAELAAADRYEQSADYERVAATLASGTQAWVYFCPGAERAFDRQPSLIGELLELRPLSASDFDALFRVAADPLIWEQHPDSDRYQEVVFRSFFDEALASGGALVALDRANGQVVGSSRYHGYDPERSVIEIGWTFLARAYWGGRYNGEMKRLMLEHAFKTVNRVLFIIGPDNRRSQRAVEKIGGVPAGTTTDAKGRARVVYELTPALYAGR
jgi:RimJ/RimL family protein N-acetyltransferase